MPLSTPVPPQPLVPVSGTLFEAFQTIRIPKKVRRIPKKLRRATAPHGTTGAEDRNAIKKGTRWSESTMVEDTELQHLRASGAQHEVASAQVLGSIRRLETGVPAQYVDPEPQTTNPSSSKRMINRVKALFRSRSGAVTSDQEKVHGVYCQAKTALKRLRRSKEESTAEIDPQTSLLPGFYVATAAPIMPEAYHVNSKNSVDTEISMESSILDQPPRTPPLRPTTKFMPKLGISIPENEVAGSIIVEGPNFPRENGDTNLHVALLCLQDMSNVGETSFYWAVGAEEDGDVFSNPYGLSQIKRPVTQFDAKLRASTGPKDVYISLPSLLLTDSPTTTICSTRLRHTALHSSPGLHSTPLRSQYSVSEPPSSPPVFETPKVYMFKGHEMEQNIQFSPSLENGTSAVDLEVFEENATAAAAPLLRNVEPQLVDIRYSHAIEVSEHQEATVSIQQLSDSTLVDEPMLADTVRTQVMQRFMLPTAASSPVAPDLLPAPLQYSRTTVTVPTLLYHLPLRVVETVAFSAAWGDAECQVMAADLYRDFVHMDAPNAGSQWGMQEQYLLCRSHLVQKLDSLRGRGHLPQDVFEVVRGQLFPVDATRSMDDGEFRVYISTNVGKSVLSEDQAREILQLAIGDESFVQTSPDKEVFSERPRFGSDSYVHEEGTDDGHHRRLDSVSPSAGLHGSAGLQQHSGRRSSFLTKAAQVFRLTSRKQF
ncbi:hypothetical protein E8E13_010770 [Curvularia kusanoi]|uniref:Uncharacterized protein n=1 Tax=Curvularia kusanoi TaxID=90978 RepID=A0A9P4TMY7_CURKU|nr:hypothetical protein E8E13_010770 [Curvularia kusanoi]